MKPALRQQLDRYVRRLAELDSLLADPAVMRDAGGFRTLSREHVEVSGIVERHRRHAQRERDLAAAAEMASDPELADMAAEEAASAQAELDRLAAELQRLLLPRDPDDARPAFLEIRAGTGGDESALFAGDLLRMYTRYAERQGWRVELMSASDSELGGYKEVVARIEGDAVFGHLKYESAPAPALSPCWPSPTKRRR